MGTHPIPIHLAYGSTIERGLTDTLEEGRRNAALALLPPDVPVPDGYPDGFSEAIAPLVSLVLYLCSEQPDLASRGGPGPPRETATTEDQSRLAHLTT